MRKLIYEEEFFETIEKDNFFNLENFRKFIEKIGGENRVFDGVEKENYKKHFSIWYIDSHNTLVEYLYNPKRYGFTRVFLSGKETKINQIEEIVKQGERDYYNPFKINFQQTN